MYHLKEKTLGKAFIKAYGLDIKKNKDAERLLNWKKPSEKDKNAGDFPTVLYDLVSKRSSVTTGTLRVDQLNDLLDELAACGGKLFAPSSSRNARTLTSILETNK